MLKGYGRWTFVTCCWFLVGLSQLQPARAQFLSNTGSFSGSSSSGRVFCKFKEEHRGTIHPDITDHSSLDASAVSYCSNARAIEVSKFLLLYDDSSKTLSFDIDAASVGEDLNAILDVTLVAYGINAVNVSINLCDELAGILCPLPQYNFVGSATIPLPSSVTNDIKIPGIGFKIPDLEAVATVRLLREEDNSEAACLRVQLSNGKSTKWKGVSWGLAGVTIGSILIGLLGGLVTLLKAQSGSIISQSIEQGRSKERFVNIIAFYQFVVSTGLLSLDYPTVLTSFTLNFAWSFGLIRESKFQQTFDNLRSRTGGNLTDLIGNGEVPGLVGGTDAVSSTTSSDALSNALAKNIFAKGASQTETESTPAQLATSYFQSIAKNHEVRSFMRRATNPTANYTAPTVSQSDVIDITLSGIDRYSIRLAIPPFNAFLTIFIWFLLAVCFFLIGCVVVGAIFELASRKYVEAKNGMNGAYHSTQDSYSRSTATRTSMLINSVIRPNAIRLLLLIFWYPILVFSFYQWSAIGKKDSFAPVVLSVFTLIFMSVAIIFLAVRLVVLRKRVATAQKSWNEKHRSSAETLHEDALTNDLTSSGEAKIASPKSKRLLWSRKSKRLSRSEGTEEVIPKYERRHSAYSPFWNAYKESRWWFFVPILVATVFRAIFVGFAQSSGWAQSVALLMIELLLLLCMLMFLPYYDKSSNGLNITIQILRVIVTGCLISFNRSIGLNEIVRVVIGIVVIVLESVVVIIYFLLLVVDLVAILIRAVHKNEAYSPKNHQNINAGKSYAPGLLPQHEGTRFSNRSQNMYPGEGSSMTQVDDGSGGLVGPSTGHYRNSTNQTNTTLTEPNPPWHATHDS